MGSNMLVTWMLTLCLSLPTVMSSLTDPSSINYEECSITFNDRHWLLVYTFGVSFAIPLIALIAIYWIIYVKTSKSGPRSRSRSCKGEQEAAAMTGTGKHRSQDAIASTSDEDTISIAPQPTIGENGEGSPRRLSSVCSQENTSPSQIRLHLAREHRLVMISGIVVGAFFICWLPFWITYLMVPLCHLDWCQGLGDQRALLLSLQWFGYFNSMVNPIIYNAFNRDFKKALNEMASSRYSPEAAPE